MRKFKLNPIVLAMMAGTLSMGAYAQDQGAGDDTVEEVIVTGSFRDSLQNSMNIKRNQSGFVDAIVASDIAEFPDNNLAESMQRIPGVAITRVGGEGKNITVRGLGPLFTRVRVNGMESVSTTGGTDAANGNNRNRNFDFNTFSSDLFSSLTVRKTGSADVQEGSLGATVDLKAAQPFDYDGFVFTASGQMGYNDLSEESNPSGSFLVSNIFADGKVGALFSLSYSERSVKDEGASTVRWSNVASQRFGFSDGVAIDANHPINTAFRPRIPRYDSFQHEIERLGASTSIQFRPTDVSEISLDVLYSEHDATRQEIFMQGSLNPGRNSVTNVVDYEIRDNTLIYADLENARLITENRFDKLNTEFVQYTLSGKHEFSDRFRIDAMLGHSESDFQNPIQNTLMMLANGVDFTYDYRNGGTGVLTFGDTAYSASTWGNPASATDQTYAAVRNRPQSSLNEYDTGQVNVEFDLNDSLTFKTGVESRKFSMSTDQFVPAAGEGARSIDLHSNPNFIMEYDSGLGDGRAWLVPNRALIMEEYGFFDSPMDPNYANTWSVDEDTLSYFAQLDFTFDIGSMNVRGDVGVRHFTTDQTSTGWSNANNAARALTTVDHDYSDTLPSLNLTAEPIENFLIRFGYSEGISRPGLLQITPVVSTTVAGTNKTVTGNNPFLEPTKAKSYDLGFEWYFAEESMISLALFKKEIESHIQTIRTTPVFTDIGLPTQLVIDACNIQGASLGGYGPNCNENEQWNYSVAANGPGGDLDGFEISYQQPFTFLPGILSNFGFIGSFTKVDSDLAYLNPAGEVQAIRPLIDLSDESSSATLYYEDDKFSGRVSIASRSGYLTTPIGRDGNEMEGTEGTTNVDASFGYQLNDNWKFTFEALNLTDEVDDQWVGSEDDKRLSYYHSTGRQYYLGVQYKY
ncbi:TonB-dependent receptor [Cellvibrio sp. UBA7661]|uniref:TonB-dependent receptor n=1 Tax=Cellvibrio sp. UBA7661 TaxID=1946311 RepID=UPI002F359490